MRAARPVTHHRDCLLPSLPVGLFLKTMDLLFMAMGAPEAGDLGLCSQLSSSPAPCFPPPPLPSCGFLFFPSHLWCWGCHAPRPRLSLRGDGSGLHPACVHESRTYRTSRACDSSGPGLRRALAGTSRVWAFMPRWQGWADAWGRERVKALWGPHRTSHMTPCVCLSSSSVTSSCSPGSSSRPSSPSAGLPTSSQHNAKAAANSSSLGASG